MVDEDYNWFQQVILEGDPVESRVKIQELVQILNRSKSRGRRRGGPTTTMLLRLQDLIPWEFSSNFSNPKSEIIDELLMNTWWGKIDRREVHQMGGTTWFHRFRTTSKCEGLQESTF